MSPRIEAIAEHNFSVNERLFFDTNIWILLYAPRIGLDTRDLSYSAALRSIQEIGAEIWCTSFVLAEFIQAYALRAWRTRPNKRQHPEFKRFREDETVFASLHEELVDAIDKMKMNAKLVETVLDTQSVLDLLPAFRSGNADFADLIVADYCIKNGLTLVTDDADFATTGVSLLSANPKLLAKAKN